MRWLGIDYGTQRIGVAVGNDTDGIASPLAAIDARDLDAAIAQLADLAGDYDATGLVVGWPLNMDDSEGPQGKLVRQVAARIAAATKLDVRLWDERLSSFAADQSLAGKFTRKKKKQRQDAVAAAVILEDFFSAGGPDAAPRPDELP